jgi:hypothetical protein
MEVCMREAVQELTKKRQKTNTEIVLILEY